MIDNLVPLQEDLLLSEHKLDIFKGLEGIVRQDKKFAEGELFAEGNWAVLNDSDELEAPTATPVANTYPVWAGNAEGRTDVHATGMLTIVMGGRFWYRTTMYDTAPTYSVGDALTVKDLGAGEMVPTKATGTEAVLARVYKVPANGIMEIEVL